MYIWGGIGAEGWWMSGQAVWSKGLDYVRPMLSRWSAAVRSVWGKATTHQTGWNREKWSELAGAFAPSACQAREKQFLRDLLHAADDRRLGALPAIWRLQTEFSDDEFREELLHNRLEERDPHYRQLLEAIRAYEGFARSLQDAFDVMKAEAATLDERGFSVPEIATDVDFKHSVTGLHERFEVAHRAFGEVTTPNVSLQNLFADRFTAFAEPMEPGACALALCSHHEMVQRAKSADGKRPWFDRIGLDGIYIRHQYREPRRDIMPGRYVHDYRGLPIRRFISTYVW
jgi:hypothetical protein